MSVWASVEIATTRDMERKIGIESVGASGRTSLEDRTFGKRVVLETSDVE